MARFPRRVNVESQPQKAVLTVSTKSAEAKGESSGTTISRTHSLQQVVEGIDFLGTHSENHILLDCLLPVEVLGRPKMQSRSLIWAVSFSLPHSEQLSIPRLIRAR